VKSPTLSRPQLEQTGIQQTLDLRSRHHNRAEASQPQAGMSVGIDCSF